MKRKSFRAKIRAIVKKMMKAPVVWYGGVSPDSGPPRVFRYKAEAFGYSCDLYINDDYYHSHEDICYRLTIETGLGEEVFYLEDWPKSWVRHQNERESRYRLLWPEGWIIALW
jgi:hypothetical protein